MLYLPVGGFGVMANVNIWPLAPAGLNQRVFYIFKLSWYTLFYVLLKLKARRGLWFHLLVNAKQQKLSASIASQKNLHMQFLDKCVLICHL